MTGPSRLLSTTGDILFGAENDDKSRIPRLAAFGILYFLGVVFWIWYFAFGRASLTFADWVYHSATLNTLREAMLHGTLPWSVAVPGGSGYSYQVRFLLTLTPLTPDVLLLPLISNAGFSMIHTLILYTIGFYGSFRLARRVGANMVTFVFFWMLFNFNGFITAQLSVGHFEYTGYFMLPFFMELMIAVAVSSNDHRWAIDLKNALLIALVIGWLVMDGGVHVAVWGAATLILMMLWRWNSAPTVLTALGAGVALGFCRLLPAAIFVPTPGQFVSGFPDLGELIFGLTKIHVPDYSYLVGGRWGLLNWWEYDVYIGTVALLVMAVLAVLAFRRRDHLRWAPLIAASIVVFFFSMGDNYWVIRRVIPFASTERVSSRFITIPLVFLLVVGMEGSVLAFQAWPRLTRVLSLGTLPLVAAQLLNHDRHWTVTAAARLLHSDPTPLYVLTTNHDIRYALVTACAWAVSAIALAIVLLVLFRLRDESSKPTQTTTIAKV